jgi:hypothetical protein
VDCGFEKEGTEENICIQESWENRRPKKILNLYLLQSISEGEMSTTFSMHGKVDALWEFLKETR